MRAAESSARGGTDEYGGDGVMNAVALLALVPLGMVLLPVVLAALARRTTPQLKDTEGER